MEALEREGDGTARRSNARTLERQAATPAASPPPLEVSTLSCKLGSECRFRGAVDELAGVGTVRTMVGSQTGT
jgi:hypothetical protein